LIEFYDEASHTRGLVCFLGGERKKAFGIQEDKSKGKNKDPLSKRRGTQRQEKARQEKTR